MKPHALSMVFPAMSDEDFARLVESMRTHGYDQNQPIITLDGQILDGRHRYRAAQEAGVKPLIVEFSPRFGDPALWVMARNLARRHLTASQRAAVAADIEPYFSAETQTRRKAALQQEKAKNVGKSPLASKDANGGKAAGQAAKVVGVSQAQVERAKAVKTASPELHEKVKAGEVSLAEAQRRVKSTPPPPLDEPETFIDVNLKPVTDDGIMAALRSGPRFDELMRRISTLRSDLKAFCDDPVSAEIRFQKVDTDLRNAFEGIKFGKPHCQCPHMPNCKLGGCRVCKDRGWVTRPIYDNMPREVKR